MEAEATAVTTREQMRYADGICQREEGEEEDLGMLAYPLVRRDFLASSASLSFFPPLTKRERGKKEAKRGRTPSFHGQMTPGKHKATVGYDADSEELICFVQSLFPTRLQSEGNMCFSPSPTLYDIFSDRKREREREREGGKEKRSLCSRT